MAQQPALAVHRALLMRLGEMCVGSDASGETQNLSVLAAETPGNHLIDSMVSTLEQQPAALGLKAEGH